jgi:hypothetical protein
VLMEMRKIKQIYKSVNETASEDGY